MDGNVNEDCNGDGDGNEDGKHVDEDGVESSSTPFVLEARWRIYIYIYIGREIDTYIHITRIMAP